MPEKFSLTLRPVCSWPDVVAQELRSNGERRNGRIRLRAGSHTISTATSGAASLKCNSLLRLPRRSHPLLSHSYPGSNQKRYRSSTGVAKSSCFVSLVLQCLFVVTKSWARRNKTYQSNTRYHAFSADTRDRMGMPVRSSTLSLRFLRR